MQNQRKGNALLKSFRFTQPQLDKLLWEYQTYGFTQQQILTAWQQCGQDLAAFHSTLIQNNNGRNSAQQDLQKNQLQIKQQLQNNSGQLYQSTGQSDLDFQQFDSLYLQDQLKTASPLSTNWVPVGLINLGNTCYINIMLQYMFNIVPFRQLIFNTVLAAPGKSGQILLQKLQELFALMQSGNRNYLSPNKFLDTLQEFKPSSLLLKGEQNDYYELQILFLDAIEQAVLELNNESVTNEFKQIFYGESEEILICENKVIKTTPTQFGSISVEIKEGDLMKAFSASRILNIDDYETPDKVITKVIIHQNIKTPPKILQFYLNRTIYDLNKRDIVKNNTQFQFPTSIDINQFIQDKSIIQSKEMTSLLKQEEEVLQQLKRCGEADLDNQFDKMIELFTQLSTQTLIEQKPPLQPLQTIANQLALYKESIVEKRQELQLQFIRIEEQKKRLIETKKNMYSLTAVLMHAGSATSGHYYCYLNDGKSWWKFNDRVVTMVDYPQVYCDALGKNNESSNVTGLIYQHNDLLNSNRIVELGNELQNFVNGESESFLTLIDKQNILKRKAKLLQRAAEHKILYPHNQLGQSLIKYQYFEEYLAGHPNRQYYVRRVVLDEELQFIQASLFCPQKREEYKQYFIKNSGLFPQNFEQLFLQDYQQFVQKNNMIANFVIQSQITSINFQSAVNQLQKYCQMLFAIDQQASQNMQILLQALLLKGCFLCDLNVQKSKLTEARQLMQFILDVNKTRQKQT